MKNKINKLTFTSMEVRKKILELITKSKSSHIGCAYSLVDILIVLFYEILNVNKIKSVSPDRDRFVLSKGHACVALYVILSKLGFFNKKILNTYYSNNGRLAGHPVFGSVPGIEASTGSLGHGLSIAAGMALSAKLDNKKYSVYTIIGDGECDEGSIWEAALFATHHKLNNLTVILDKNGFQGYGRTSDVLSLEPLRRKWEAFNWNVKEIDGHNILQIYNSLANIKSKKPLLIIAKTVHCKGIPFMEDSLMWHYRSPKEDEFKKALCNFGDKIK